MQQSSILMVNKLWKEEQQLFRACLKNIRASAGLTQQELALLLHKPQSYVSKYESGERKLDYLEVRKICVVCKTSIKQLEEELSQLITE